MREPPADVRNGPESALMEWEQKQIEERQPVRRKAAPAIAKDPEARQPKDSASGILAYDRRQAIRETQKQTGSMPQGTRRELHAPGSISPQAEVVTLSVLAGVFSIGQFMVWRARRLSPTGAKARALKSRHGKHGQHHHRRRGKHSLHPSLRAGAVAEGTLAKDAQPEKPEPPPIVTPLADGSLWVIASSYKGPDRRRADRRKRKIGRRLRYKDVPSEKRRIGDRRARGRRASDRASAGEQGPASPDDSASQGSGFMLG